jgi:Tfp pilus assembly pilus retraction ATPase PilT
VFDIDNVLRSLVEAEGSDLHLKVPAPPTVRVHGELRPLEEGGEPLTGDITQHVLHAILPNDKIAELKSEHEVDVAYSLPSMARFLQSGRVAMDVALKAATGPHDFKLLVAAEGRTATTTDDVAEASDRNSLVA